MSLGPRMIHMGHTVETVGGEFYALCRCGWRSEICGDRFLARRAGDAHLGAANHSPEEPE